MFTLLMICLLADEGMWPYNQFPKEKVRMYYRLSLMNVETILEKGPAFVTLGLLEVG